MKRILTALFAALILMFGTPLAANAATSNSRDYSTLAARWWTWALTQPASTSPLLDTTGAHCANQQSGNTWFLVGLFNTGGTVTRNCTIPTHTAVFFPLANAFDCELATDNVPAKTVRTATDYVQNGASNLSVTLDGISMASAIEFEHSDLFSLTLGADTIFGSDAAGYYYPCVDSGYYALLSNLSPGTHTLQFTGALSSQTINVTYYLAVQS